MPQVIHSYKGENRQPRLKLPKTERFILSNAAGLCRAIEAATCGHNVEIAARAGELASGLEKLSTLEVHDLTQPF